MKDEILRKTSPKVEKKGHWDRKWEKKCKTNETINQLCQNERTEKTGGRRGMWNIKKTRGLSSAQHSKCRETGDLSQRQPPSRIKWGRRQGDGFPHEAGST